MNAKEREGEEGGGRGVREEEEEEEGRRRIIEGTEKGGMHSWAS